MKDINARELKALARMFCTPGEAAAYFDCHPDTLNDRCHEWYDMHAMEYFWEQRQAGVAMLKRVGVRKALKGDNEMLKFYQKNFGGMTDKTDVQMRDKNGAPTDPLGPNPFLVAALAAVEKSEENGQ